MVPRFLLFVALFASLLVSGPALAQVSQPESVGFSREGLKAFQQEMRTLVDEAKLAGLTTLVARHGKVVHLDAAEWRSSEWPAIPQGVDRGIDADQRSLSA